MPEETDLYALSARDGDGEAFTALYERVAPSLAVWADVRLHGPLRKRHDPEDLVHEVWWRALESFSRFDPDQGRFRSWIFGIANNVFLSLIRRSGSRNAAVRGADSLPPHVDAQLTSITTRACRSDSALKLADFVRTLPDDDAEILVRCALEGSRVKDVAPAVGATPEAVKKRWQRLRARLQELPLWAEFLPDGDAA